MAAEMAPTTLEIVRTLIPVATFALGLVISLIGQWIRFLIQRGRTRRMLLSELSRNYEFLVYGIPDSELSLEDHLLTIKGLARATESFQFSIFDSSIGNLGQLTSSEAKLILNTYWDLRELSRHAQEFISLINIPNRDPLQKKQLVARTIVVRELAQASFHRCRDSISLLPGGSRILRQLGEIRGEGLDMIKRMDSALAKLGEEG